MCHGVQVNPNPNSSPATYTSDVTLLDTLLNLSDPHFMHQGDLTLIPQAYIGHLLYTSTPLSTEGSWMSMMLFSLGSSEPLRPTEW